MKQQQFFYYLNEFTLISDSCENDRSLRKDHGILESKAHEPVMEATSDGGRPQAHVIPLIIDDKTYISTPYPQIVLFSVDISFRRYRKM